MYGQPDSPFYMFRLHVKIIWVKSQKTPTLVKVDDSNSGPLPPTAPSADFSFVQEIGMLTR